MSSYVLLPFPLISIHLLFISLFDSPLIECFAFSLTRSPFFPHHHHPSHTPQFLLFPSPLSLSLSLSPSLLLRKFDSPSFIPSSSFIAQFCLSFLPSLFFSITTLSIHHTHRALICLNTFRSDDLALFTFSNIIAFASRLAQRLSSHSRSHSLDRVGNTDYYTFRTIRMLNSNPEAKFEFELDAPAIDGVF
jgi:hypothetical protein